MHPTASLGTLNAHHGPACEGVADLSTATYAYTVAIQKRKTGRRAPETDGEQSPLALNDADLPALRIGCVESLLRA
jgi:hypothetical protein